MTYGPEDYQRTDAYDKVEHEKGYALEEPRPDEVDQTPIRPGPWYHVTRSPGVKPGTILDADQPNNFNYYSEELRPRDRWVFMHNDPEAASIYGDNVFEVEPIGDGPYAYNGEDKAWADGWVAPKAKVLRKWTPPPPAPEVKSFADAMEMMAARADAYDSDRRDPLGPDQTPVRAGPWFHSTGAELEPGAILDANYPNNFDYGYGGGAEGWAPRDDWVFMDNAPGEDYGRNVYEVEPIDEGPYPWNGEDWNSGNYGGRAINNDGWVSPRAKVVRKWTPDEADEFWKQRGEPSQRIAMPVPGPIHRGLSLNLDNNPSMKQILDTYGPESPEFITELLRQGTGTYWSRDKGFAETVNPGAGLQVAMEADWDGNDAQELHPELTRKLPDSWGDMSLLAPADNTVAKEFNLKPNKELNVKSIRVRPRGSNDWREVLRQPVRARTAARGGLIVLGAQPPTLDSINPTGGVFVDYDPESRTGPHGPRVTTLDKVRGLDPNEMVTIYRGAPSVQQQINPGDFITTDEMLAQMYGENVLRMQVPMSHVATDPDEWEGGEHIYSPRTAGLHLAMPAWEAYDRNDPHVKAPPEGSPDPEPGEGPWWHANGQKFEVGDLITPNKGYYPSKFNDWYEMHDLGDRQNWVWMDRPDVMREAWGNDDKQYVYEVEPEIEGPWPWNGPDNPVASGWVAPQARVKRVIRPRTAPEPRWKSPNKERPRLVGPVPPDPNARDEQLERAAALRLGMPAADAYDNDWDPDLFPKLDPPLPPEVFQHSTGRELAVGDIIEPNGGRHRSDFDEFYDEGTKNRQDWVWMSSPRDQTDIWHDDDEYLYDVEPLDDGPHPWNGGMDPSWVSQRARVKRVVKSPTASVDQQAMALAMMPLGVLSHTAATYYHYTDKPDFELDPNFSPTNLASEDTPEDLVGSASADGDEGVDYGPGIFLSQDPTLWADPYSMGDRPHRIVFDAPDDLPTRPGVRTPYWNPAIEADAASRPDEVFVPANMYDQLKQRTQ